MYLQILLLHQLTVTRRAEESRSFLKHQDLPGITSNVEIFLVLLQITCGFHSYLNESNITVNHDIEIMQTGPLSNL